MKLQKTRRLAIRATLPILTAFAMVASAAIATSAPAIVGDWHGAISTGGGSMRVVLHVSQGDDGKLTATLDSPDQGATGIPVTTVSFKEPNLHFEIEKFSCSYDGKINKDNSEIAGQWKQGGATVSLNFKRADK